jgi:FAD/FMN-containing dehydrogenase
VCRIIKILYKYRVKFAICAGGFSLNPETSNVDKGIVINLRALNSVQVSQDGTAVMVGGGAKWKEVYYHLDPLGLAISGGRIADAGVGGLATGGIEHFRLFIQP